YAFSTENWERGREEVAFLMRLMERTIILEVPELHAQGIRLVFAGDRTALPNRCDEVAESLWMGHSSVFLRFPCFLGHDVWKEAPQGLHEVDKRVEWLTNRPLPEGVHLSDRLSTHMTHSLVGDPDPLIRVSWEQQLSNFLLSNCAYTELYFTSTCWPNFAEKGWEDAVRHFASKQRRYG
ncbi:hypothetical protein VOLCADRAFT_44343, partial [Volvox carteri f. nagariensis]